MSRLTVDPGHNLVLFNYVVLVTVKVMLMEGSLQSQSQKTKKKGASGWLSR